VAPDGDSENLRDLEEHAAEAKDAQQEGDEPADEQEAEQAGTSTGDAFDEEGSDTEYGVENDMRPGGPAPGEAEADGPTKTIDEDVTGKEETEHMSELHTDD
jgi:hypothetical protein